MAVEYEEETLQAKQVLNVHGYSAEEIVQRFRVRCDWSLKAEGFFSSILCSGTIF